MGASAVIQVQAEDDPRLSELREVKLVLVGQRGEHFFQSYIVHQAEVDRLVEACKRLYDEPGINPHNGMKTSKLKSIHVSRFGYAGPYWWSTPDLMENHDSRGARIVSEKEPRVVFVDQRLELLAQEN